MKQFGEKDRGKRIDDCGKKTKEIVVGGNRQKAATSRPGLIR